jgi:hypothetical protein
MTYTRNRACGCMRCRCSSLMWPTMLVLLGVLFLFDNFNVFSFDRGWPLILIAAGAVWVLQSSASTSGHIDPAPPAAPGLAPPPAPAEPAAGGDDKQVHNG